MNMGFSDGFGGLGRLYIVCSLIHALIVTVSVLSDYHSAPIRFNYRRTYMFHFFKYFTYFPRQFNDLYEIHDVCGNSQVSF